MKKCPAQMTHAQKYPAKKYVERGGALVLSLDAHTLTEGVEEMNRRKVGRPYQYSDAMFTAIALFRHAMNIPYRQLQGVVRQVSDAKNTPSYSQIFKRVSRLY